MKCFGLSLCFALSVSVGTGSGQPRDERNGNPGRVNHNWIEAKPALGDPAPEFKLTDLNGVEVRLKDLVGKRPVVIEFGSYT